MMKRRLLLWLLLLAAAVGVVQGQDTVTLRDTVLLLRTDTVFLIRTDTVKVRVVDSSMLRNVQEREALMAEKEKFYKEIFTKSGVDQNKIEADRDHYRHLVDSLNRLVREAELENVRKEEANKYLLQRAKDAEARVAEATNRKKKVRAIQGIAMRFYRTPNWEVRLQPAEEAGTYNKVLRNRNAGNIEFDFVTGASVMLWDLTQYFNKDIKSVKIGETNLKTPELRKFDQDFAYDVGIYVGFGGSNLFKNFYVGPSFRFVDFFYFTVGVNIAEYNVLVSGYGEGSILKSETIDDVTAKSWLLKPFLALSIDLDFLSYIKK
jgi:hypothetical protein